MHVESNLHCFIKSHCHEALTYFTSFPLPNFIPHQRDAYVKLLQSRRKIYATVIRRSLRNVPLFSKHLLSYLVTYGTDLSIFIEGYHLNKRYSYIQTPGIRVAWYMWHTCLIIIRCYTTHVNVAVIIRIIATRDAFKTYKKKHRILNDSDRKMNMPFACEFARFHLSLGCFLH